MKLTNFYSLLALVAILFTTSCSGVFSVDLTSPESEVQLKEKIGKVIDADDKVVQIIFSTTHQGFTSDVEIASTNYFDGETPMAKIVPLGKGDVRDSSPSSIAFNEDDDTGKYMAEGIKFSDINFSIIHKNIANAKAIMESDSINLPFSGLGLYTMNLADPQNVIHRFAMQSAGETKVTGGGGVNLQTEYTELNFEADAEGNVTLKEY